MIDLVEVIAKALVDHPDEGNSDCGKGCGDGR